MVNSSLHRCLYTAHLHIHTPLQLGTTSDSLSILVCTAATASAEQEERNINYLCVAHVGAAASADWGQGRSNWFWHAAKFSHPPACWMCQPSSGRGGCLESLTNNFNVCGLRLGSQNQNQVYWPSRLSPIKNLLHILMHNNKQRFFFKEESKSKYCKSFLW